MLEPSVAAAGRLVPAASREHDGYVIAGFTPEDAADIPPAFRAVYGDDYLSHPDLDTPHTARKKL